MYCDVCCGFVCVLYIHIDHILIFLDCFIQAPLLDKFHAELGLPV